MSWKVPETVLSYLKGTYHDVPWQIHCTLHIWQVTINRNSGPVLACVASVPVGFGSKEREFWCFACAKNGERAKNEIWEWGRGRKETLADKPLDFENLRSPANGARDWLG